MREDFMFTSESVTEGHPDKLCDQVSDAVVDHFLDQDPFALVRVECAVSTGILFIAARFNSLASVDIPEVARQVIRQVGYDREDFNAKTCTIMTSLNEMPALPRPRAHEAELSEDELEAIPARNQVTVFGFACTQTSALVPLPIWLAHKLARRLSSVRLKGLLDYLAPDGKTQVGVEYRGRRPHRIHSITLVASQYLPDTPAPAALRDDLLDLVIEPAFVDEEVRPDADTRIFVNPGGPLVVGGPTVHSGLTGRKTAIDTYGEYARHSGAALSGKDPSRIDRVGAYAARYAAKNIVAAGLAEECEVQLSYTVGLPRPVSVQVETFGTGRLPEAEIGARVEQNFDLRPAGIVRDFNARRLPSVFKGRFYSRLASYGHMGRLDVGLPWEVTDKAGQLA
jgi:S-adenosylmethionine synthetase